MKPSKRVISPLALSFLLEVYVTPVTFERNYALTQELFTADLLDPKAIDLRVTEKGRAYCELLCQTPTPIRKEQVTWIDPRTGEEVA